MYIVGLWELYAPSGVQRQSPWAGVGGQCPLTLKGVLKRAILHLEFDYLTFWWVLSDILSNIAYTGTCYLYVPIPLIQRHVYWAVKRIIEVMFWGLDHLCFGGSLWHLGLSSQFSSWPRPCGEYAFLLYLVWFFGTKPRDLLGRTSLKWPILCEV